jgi:hypothetical protein
VPTTKQISVFFENRPGRLASVLSTLQQDKVNLIGMTVMDSHEHSVLRFVPDDLDRTRRALRGLNTHFTEADVVLVELRNQPGALAHVCEVLAAEHISIDYAYASAGGRNGKTFGIFKVSNPEKAMRVLNGSPNSSTQRKLGRRPVRDLRAYQPRGTAGR